MRKEMLILTLAVVSIVVGSAQAVAIDTRAAMETRIGF